VLVVRTGISLATCQQVYSLIASGNSNITLTSNSNVSTFIGGNTTAQLVVTNAGANISVLLILVAISTLLVILLQQVAQVVI
jgi:hypothetical protein